MGKIKDLKGQKFGKLVAINRICKSGVSHWECKCDCGNYTVASTNNLIRGNTKSCGCLQKERTSQTHKIHGARHTRLYTIWNDMRLRCNKKNNKSYKNYGLRGISVCNEWNVSFKNFQKWALENGYQENLTIDRIDVNGNYCPENCRWTSVKEQNNNRRTNVYVTVNGKTLTIAQWSEVNNIPYLTIQMRRKRGWSNEDSVSIPVRKKGAVLSTNKA